MYEGIASIDLFTEYFHFNVIPCCFRCCFGFENILNWPQWNDFTTVRYKWYIIVISWSEWDCYNDISIACVLNIRLYHWLLIYRAMLDKIQLKHDWNRFGLAICGRHLILQSTLYISCAPLIWVSVIFFLVLPLVFVQNQPVKICYCDSIIAWCVSSSFRIVWCL